MNEFEWAFGSARKGALATLKKKQNKKSNDNARRETCDAFVREALRHGIEQDGRHAVHRAEQQSESQQTDGGRGVAFVRWERRVERTLGSQFRFVIIKNKRLRKKIKIRELVIK